MRTHEKLSAFLELELAIRTFGWRLHQCRRRVKFQLTSFRPSILFVRELHKMITSLLLI